MTGIDKWLAETREREAEFIERARKDPALMLAYVIDTHTEYETPCEEWSSGDLWRFGHAVCGICRGPERGSWLSDLADKFEECVTARTKGAQEN